MFGTMPPKVATHLPLPQERAELTPQFITDEYEREGDASRMSLSSTTGVSNIMRLYMKSRGIKTTIATTNAEKWRVIVRDCVPSEMMYADPMHYNAIPRRFAFRRDFWTHHTLGSVQRLHGGFLHFLLAGFVMMTLHYYSYELYTKPLPFHPIPCAKYPSQIPCSVLKKVQDYTYSGWDDLMKFSIHYAVSMLSGRFFTTLMSPFRFVVA